MTARKRVTVTLPLDVLEAATQEAGGNLSAYVAEAVMTQAVRDSAARLVRWQEFRAQGFAELDEMQLDALDELHGGAAA
ncbi:type II toxin-antitoxin system CcdA family antitoxin [Streptomyces sp. BH097]|uniref:type II toxin-antitoxin system CcdA family antitoxin n=1 Tax=unclassified Streptomyces TaxID=2593676 RepID=UPI003BB79C9B